MKMPRGAIPVARSELAASEPYQPSSDAKIFAPTGQFPTSNNDLAAALPYRPTAIAPESFLAWPIAMGPWADDNGADKERNNGNWAEEAFAKACATPKLFIPPDVVRFTAQRCGASNFSEFMQKHGFCIDRHAYLDGPFRSLDWTNAAALHDAIAHVGPVKIGVAAGSVKMGQRGQVTPGKSGWGIYGLLAGQPAQHCASLCGYGPLPTLVDLFGRHGVEIRLPSDMPAGLCYAMFLWGSIGVIDRQSLMNITGEAWVRYPTTIIKPLT